MLHIDHVNSTSKHESANEIEGEETNVRERIIWIWFNVSVVTHCYIKEKKKWRMAFFFHDVSIKKGRTQNNEEKKWYSMLLGKLNEPQLIQA